MNAIPRAVYNFFPQRTTTDQKPMKNSLTSLMRMVSAALRYGRFDTCVLKMRGAPNLTAIRNSAAFSRYSKAVWMAQEAEKIRLQAVKDITEELKEDWTAEEIAKAFNE